MAGGAGKAGVAGGKAAVTTEWWIMVVMACLVLAGLAWSDWPSEPPDVDSM